MVAGDKIGDLRCHSREFMFQSASTARITGFCSEALMAFIGEIDIHVVSRKTAEAFCGTFVADKLLIVDGGSCSVKMYILVRESVPTGFAILGAAHASLACYLKFRDSPEVTTWLAGPFYKVVCRVSDGEFEAAKAFEDNVVMTESALAGTEIAIAFRPREKWPKAFQFYKLYR
jgi:hypothetical protein